MPTLHKTLSRPKPLEPKKSVSKLFYNSFRSNMSRKQPLVPQASSPLALRITKSSQKTSSPSADASWL